MPGGGERVLGVEHRDVEVAQPAPDALLLGRELGALVAQPLAARLQAGDLVAGEVEADRPQLLDQSTVAAGGVGLALQRA